MEAWHCQISETLASRILPEHFHGTFSRLVDVTHFESRTQKEETESVGRGLNHGRSQILDAPAQAIPANVPGVVHNQLLCYIQSLRHSLICTRVSDMPLPGSGCTLGAGGSCQA